MNRSIYVALATFICFVQSIAVGLAAVPGPASPVTTVVLTNDLAPGTSGRRFASFSKPVLNDVGKVAFPAQLQCCSPTTTIHSNGRGSLELVAINGSPAEPGGMITFSGLGDVQLDNLGRSTVTAQLNNVPAEFKGTFVGQTNQNLTRVVVPGQPIVAGDNSTTYYGIGTPDVSGSGYLAGVSVSRTSSHIANGEDVLWKSDGTSLAQAVMREGYQLNFHPAGVVVGTYYNSAFEDVMVNNLGQMALRVSNVDKRGATTEFYGDDLLLIEPGGSYNKIAERSQASAPYGELSFPVLNDHEAAAFAGGAVYTDTLYRKLFGGAVQPIATHGGAAPGMPGVAFDWFFTDFNSIMPLWISNRGHVAFWASLVGAPLGPSFKESAWIGSPGNIHPVIVEGQAAPGTGSVFSSMSSTIGDMIIDMAVNNNSQIAVWAYWEAAPGELRPGLFATDVNGNLKKIVAYGDMLEVAPGVFRQVVNFNFQGDKELRRQTGFNDLGQIAFQANFLDGTSGVFISNVVAVPEPTGATLFFLAGALFQLAKRQLCAT